MFFSPLKYKDLDISSGYRNQLPGQLVKNSLYSNRSNRSNRLYPVKTRWRLATEEEKKALLLEFPDDRFKSFGWPVKEVVPIENDDEIKESFFDFKNRRLKGFRNLGETRRVKNKKKDGKILKIQEKLIVASLSCNYLDIRLITGI